MIKKFKFLMILTLITFALTSTAILSSNIEYTEQIFKTLPVSEDEFEDISEISQSDRHVMAEMLSTTWCPNCPRAEHEILELYESGQYPFHFVTLVIDKNPGEPALNPVAYTRARWLSAAYIPMLYLDGGYEVADSVNNYGNVINQLSERDTFDLDIEVVSEWLGNAKIQMTVTITNNEPSTYIGHLRVYVTEIESRWIDNDGDPIPYALLDFALNKYVSIGAGETYVETTTFDGAADHDGNTYDDISQDNIHIIASISYWRPHLQKNPWEEPKPTRFLAQFVDNSAESSPQ